MKKFLRVLTAAALSALALMSAGCMGCVSKELDNAYDEKKLPPKPTDGRGPKASGAAAPQGAAPAGASDNSAN